MQVPTDLSIWLSQQARPLFVIVALLALIFITLYLSARARTIRMNAVRSGLNEDTFVNSLLPYGFDPFLARTTYRYLQQEQKVSFPIKASDLLDEDFGLDVGGLRKSIFDILALTDRDYQPGLQHSPIVSVEDLVRFIQASPRRSLLAA